jgi:hypothetical protein
MGILGWSLTVVGLLAGAAGVATIAGCFVPRGHVAARTLTLRQPPEAVWGVLRDGESWPGWWDLLKSVRRQTAGDGHEQWDLDYKDGNGFVLGVDESTAPWRLALRIDDVKRLFEGRWEYDIAAVDGGSRVTLTEYGSINNPFVRLMAKLCMDPHMYIDKNLKALAGKFGETPVLN